MTVTAAQLDFPQLRHFIPEAAGTHARRGDYKVTEIAHGRARSIIVHHHYSRGASNTSVFAFGLERGGGVVGSALWMPPTKPCAISVAEQGWLKKEERVPADWRRVLSLSRLALAPGEPTNAASILIGACIRAIRRERKWSWLVTYAHVSQGHTGVIYRATNWTYVGLTKPEAQWVDENGRQVAKLSTKSRTTAQMVALGYRMIGRFPKHKFVMRLHKSLPLAADRMAA